MTDKLLEVKGLGKRYDGFTALKGVDFSLLRGDVKAVMGPNGAGKSTLLKLLSGELEITDGSVKLAGIEIKDLPSNERTGLGIAYLPQRPSNFPTLTVKENVRGAAQSGSIWRRSLANSKMSKLLDLVGLEDRAGKKAAELPFGDKRLLDLAMALAGEPRLLLADEPTAGVDEESSEKILQLLKSLSGSGSMGKLELDGLIFTEHDREVLLEFPDEIVFLSGGEVIVEAEPDRIRDHEIVRDYLREHRLFAGEPGDGTGDA